VRNISEQVWFETKISVTLTKKIAKIIEKSKAKEESTA
jgi:hypothetical protein